MQYIYSEDGVNSDGKIYTDGEVLYRLNELNQLIISSNILTNYKALEFYHFYPLTIKEPSTKSLKEHYYGIKKYGKPYCINNAWYLDIHYEIDTYRLQQAWDTIRKKRDEALKNSDWVESSSSVSDDTKQRYKAYRQLLRDCISCATYPEEVYLPKVPSIYITTVNDGLSIDDLIIEKLKDYKPADEDRTAWNIFLTEWKNYNFTNNLAMINNLLLVWMNKTLDNLFDEQTT